MARPERTGWTTAACDAALAPVVEQELGGAEDGAAGGDLVVDEQAVRAVDVADDVRRPRLLVVARSAACR